MGMKGAHLTLYSMHVYNVSMDEEIRTNHTVAYRCHYHVVWCPKYRRKVLLNGVDERLKQIITQASEEYHAVIEDMEVMPDHVHLLVIVDPQFGIHRLVKLLKGRSSRFLRQEFPHLKTRMPTLWTNSYFVATVGGAPLALVKQYIEGQKHV
jgi:putative transposase